jgi:hypothetical protein
MWSQDGWGLGGWRFGGSEKIFKGKMSRVPGAGGANLPGSRLAPVACATGLDVTELK